MRGQLEEPSIGVIWLIQDAIGSSLGPSTDASSVTRFCSTDTAAAADMGRF